jgi:hypothetical protein
MRLATILLVALPLAADDLPAREIEALFRGDRLPCGGGLRLLVPCQFTPHLLLAHDLRFSPSAGGTALEAILLLPPEAAEALPDRLAAEGFPAAEIRSWAGGPAIARLLARGEPLALAKSLAKTLDSLPRVPGARGLHYPPGRPFEDALGCEAEQWPGCLCVRFGRRGRAWVVAAGRDGARLFGVIAGEREGAAREAGFTVEGEGAPWLFSAEAAPETLGAMARALGPTPPPLGLAFDRESDVEGFAAGTTGLDGAAATWSIRDGHLSLVSTNHEEGGAYNLYWRKGTFRDGTISVRIRADSGEEDQGGGLVWRAIDRNNYYVARYNPLERNFRLYHVKEGKRTTLADKAGVKIGAGEWFTLAIRVEKARFEASLDGERLLEGEDGTFPDAGGIGFWTKADAKTSFDDLYVEFE